MDVTKFFIYDEDSAGSKGLVYIGDDILAYRRDNKTKLFPLTIDLPGGGPEDNETPFETFRRELQEEFGLDITREDIVYARRYKSTLKQNKYTWFAVAQLPESAKNHITFGDEGLGYMFFSEAEFLKLTDAWDVLQKRAKDYFDAR